MNQSARNTLIGAVTCIVTLLIGAGAAVWATQTPAETAGAHDPILVTSMTATVTARGTASSDTKGPVKADLCVLTNVGSYGGATKGCTLNRENDTWTLVASARQATSTCQAMCFNLRPGPNGPPSN